MLRAARNRPLRNQDIVLKPGLYVIKDGAFAVNGGSSLTGAGVTIFLANAGASLQLNGNSVVRLAAPAGGSRSRTPP